MTVLSDDGDANSIRNNTLARITHNLSLIVTHDQGEIVQNGYGAKWDTAALLGHFVYHSGLVKWIINRIKSLNNIIALLPIPIPNPLPDDIAPTSPPLTSQGANNGDVKCCC